MRLGLRLVRGFNIEAGHRIVQARLQEAFVNIDDLSRRAALDARELERLAGADALQALAGHRFQARWQTRGHARLDGVLANTELPADAVALAAPRESEDVISDYQSTHMSLRRHPAALLRPRFDSQPLLPNAHPNDKTHGNH